MPRAVTAPRGGGRFRGGVRGIAGLLLAAAAAAPLAAEPHSSHSVARQWNELQLQAIRKDYAFPTIHARNLYHVSVAMWDAWAAYDEHAQPVLADERAAADDVAAARHEAVSYAAYRVLYARYLGSPGAYLTVPNFDELFDSFGYDYTDFRLQGDDPAAVGNRIAKRCSTTATTTAPTSSAATRSSTTTLP